MRHFLFWIVTFWLLPNTGLAGGGYGAQESQSIAETETSKEYVQDTSHTDFFDSKFKTWKLMIGKTNLSNLKTNKQKSYRSTIRNQLVEGKVSYSWTTEIENSSFGIIATYGSGRSISKYSIGVESNSYFGETIQSELFLNTSLKLGREHTKYKRKNSNIIGNFLELNCGVGYVFSITENLKLPLAVVAVIEKSTKGFQKGGAIEIGLLL